MFKLDFRKILRLSKGRPAAFDFKKFVGVSLKGLLYFLGVLLILDGFIFYQYSYKVTNETYTREYSIDLKNEKLGEVITKLKERERKFAEVQERGIEAPDPFR